MIRGNIAVVILAAGASKRLGQPKQLLQWEESNLINHSIKTAKNSKAQNVFVVLGASFEKINAAIIDKDVTIVFNDEWQNGMGASIAKGVEKISQNSQNYDAILLTLVDQPLVTSEDLNDILSEFENGSNEIIASEYDESKLGVPAIFGSMYFDEIGKLNGDVGAKFLFKKYANEVKKVKLSHRLTDIDTIEDYQNLYKENHPL